MNTFGHIFRLTTFGESHGAAIGGVIDGMPAGINIDLTAVQAELDRRRPGQSRLTTARKELDQVEILSGLFEGRTTGCPIGFMVRNADHHSADYDNLRDAFRPSHADYTYYYKYGVRDHRGGGRSSARETISRVVGGAFAKQALSQLGISVTAWTRQVGPITLDTPYPLLDLTRIDDNAVRCPDSEVAERMERLIVDVKAEGDTIGGVIECVVKGCPPGLGEPAFDKLQARLAAAMLSINAAKGFEYGEGFAGAAQRGSEQNDYFLPPVLDTDSTPSDADTTQADADTTPSDADTTPSDADSTQADANTTATHPATPLRLTTATNHSGGIQGGISNGQDINFRVAFKPIATLLREQPTVDLYGQPTTIKARGRHDPCVLPRAVPIVEAMAAMTILDAYLANRTTHI